MKRRQEQSGIPPTQDSSPEPAVSPLTAVPGSLRVLNAKPSEPGAAEVLQMLHDVRETMQRAWDDMLDAAYWADRVHVGSPYETGILRRCMEHSRDLMSLWMRRCEAEVQRGTK